MDGILNAGSGIILWLQSLGSWLSGPMKFFTFLGYEQFYLLVAPALFWCIDPGFGLRLGLSAMFSAGTNHILKISFHGPRPYWTDQRVAALSNETSFGAPSAHAQNAVVFWGLLARKLSRRWVWAAAIFIMFMNGVSRMYLGVHSPADVLIGWLAGAVLLWLIIRFQQPLEDWLRRFSPAVQAGIAFAASLAPIALTVLVRMPLSKWAIPSSWIVLAERSPGAEPLNPLSLAGVITPAAAFFGLAIGAILLYQHGWISASGPFWQRIGRYLIGLAGVIALWYGLDQVFPSGDTLVPYLFRYLRYGLIGLWVSYLAPLIFFGLGLARPASRSETAPEI